MESLHYLLMKTHTVLQRRIVSRAAGLRLTPGQPKILDYLLRYGESDQKTIASYCEIEQATVGSILLRMEKAGLIARRRREGNRRSLFVSLTPEGEAAARKLMQVFADAEQEAAADLSAEELASFKEMLNRICSAIQKLPEP